MNLSNKLKKQAVSLGLCEKWTNGWGNPSKDELVEKYIKGIDFCIEHNYPGNDFIKKHFGVTAEKYGIFTDKFIELYNPDITVLNGSCVGSIVFDGYSVGTIYIRHDSNVRIVCRDQAFISIRLYDKAFVSLINDRAKVYLYQYGGGFCISGSEVVIRDKTIKV